MEISDKVDFLMRVYKISYLVSILQVSKASLFLWKNAQAVPKTEHKDVISYLYGKVHERHKEDEKYASLKRELNKKTF